eukprot:4545381-Alexandrium_andersonii.AAC.1
MRRAPRPACWLNAAEPPFRALIRVCCVGAPRGSQRQQQLRRSPCPQQRKRRALTGSSLPEHQVASRVPAHRCQNVKLRHGFPARSVARTPKLHDGLSTPLARTL